MKLFQTFSLNSPTPSTNGGMSKMDATVVLSSFIASVIAKSCKDKGLTVSTSNCSAGISQGSPASELSMYFDNNFFLPSFDANSSVFASTLTIIDGFHLDFINPLIVAFPCEMFSTIVFNATLYPVPFHG